MAENADCGKSGAKKESRDAFLICILSSAGVCSRLFILVGAAVISADGRRAAAVTEIRPRHRIRPTCGDVLILSDTAGSDRTTCRLLLQGVTGGESKYWLELEMCNRL